MNDTDEKSSSSGDDLFEQKAKALFDQSVDGLDAQTQSTLNRSRQQALAETGARRIGPGRWTQWAPAAGMAIIAFVAVSFWNGEPQLAEPAPVSDFEQVSDFELIMAEESLDMLQDLDFYIWLDIDTETEPDPDALTDIG